MADGWSYYTWVAKVPNVNRLGAGLNALGADGWELVTSMSTVKSWLNVTGNDIVLIFKKPGADLAPSAEALNVFSLGQVDPPTW